MIKSDFGEQVPDDAVAFNGDSGRRLHNVYPLLYNRCVYEATERFERKEDAPPMVWSRAAWAGSQRYADAAGAAIRRATGKVSPHRSAAACHGG